VPPPSVRARSGPGVPAHGGGKGKPAGGAGAARAVSGSPFVAVAVSVFAHVGVIAALIVATTRDRAAEQEGRPARIAVPLPVTETVEAEREVLEPEPFEEEAGDAPTFEDPIAETEVARAEPEPLARPDDAPAPRFDDRFAPAPSESLGGAPFVPPIERAPIERETEPAPVEPPAPTEPPAPDVEGDDAPPELLDAPPPDYPRLARRRGWEGSALIELTLAADGRVTTAVIVDSTGRDVLDDAALEAVRTWRFVAGRAGRVAQHRVTFTLE